MSNSVLSPFGEIPNDWEYQIVIDNVDFLTGPTFDSSLFNTESRGARLVRGINLTKGSTRWSEEKTKYWDVELDSFKKFQLAVNDILIGMDGSLVGKNYAYLKDSDLPALLVQRVARLRAKGNLHPKYLYYMYATDFWLDYVEVVKTNSGIPHISNGDIKNFRFPFPPLPEQQKIAAILTSVDDGIEKTQAQINKLKDLKTGMMQELLTRGVGVDGKPHTEFKDSPVGRIPKGWDCVELDTLKHPSKYSCVGGPFGSDLTAKNYIDTAGVPVIRGTNIPLNFERFKEDNFVYVTEEKADLLVKNMAYQGDLVFTQRGTMGQVGLIPLDSKFKRYVVSQSQMKLTVNETIVSSEFLYQFFLSNNFMKQLELETIATGLPHINLGILKAFKVPIPSLSEQNEIVDILTSIDKRCLFFISKLNKLKDLKKALMQDLLTGKVRVNVD